MNQQEALGGKHNYPYVFYAILLPFVAVMEEPKVVTLTHLCIYVSSVLCTFLSKSNAILSTTLLSSTISIVCLYS